jgi:probable F420-dependent oxidoreductase
MRIGVTLPSRTGPIPQVFEYARRAEQAGFYSAFDYEVWRNPFTMLAGAAVRTERIKLGTGLAAAFSRSPFEAANAAADIDEMSGGRMLFGIGTGVPEFLTRLHSTDCKKPAGRMSEYIDVLRMSWDYLGTGKVQTFEGSHYRFDPPPVNPWGGRELARPEIPIYLAAMGPAMLDLCGRKADGWLGYFATPKLLEEAVKPHIEAGATKAGRSLSDIDLCVENICCVHPDREIAMRRARLQVGFYAIHPVSDGVARLHNFQDAINELRARVFREGLSALAHTDDRIVDVLSISGTPEEARQKIAQYHGAVDHLVLHCPYVPPFTAEESADCFANILDAFGDLASAHSGAANSAGAH